MTLDDGMMGNVLCQRRLAGAIRTDEHHVAAIGEEVEREQCFDGGAIDPLGPGPIEVAQWLEATDMRGLQAALEAALGAFLLLPADQRLDPASVASLRP